MGMEDELGLPKSTMQKTIKGLLPKEMRISGDAVDLVTRCCNEFVQLISMQANQACEAEKRSTINPEHIVKALQELDFNQYLGAVNQAWQEFKADEKEHKKAATKRSAAADSGLTQAQLMELQQKLFAEARARTLSGPLPSLELPAALHGGAAAEPMEEGGSPSPDPLQQQQ